MKRLRRLVFSIVTVIGICSPTFASDTNIEKIIEDPMLISSNVSQSDSIEITENPMVILSNILERDDNNIIVKEKNINIGKCSIVIKNGMVMVPLKATAEGLGFKVEIGKDNKTAELDNDEIKTEITVGVDSYYYGSSHAIGMTAPESLGAAPIVVEDNIYVPIEIYNIIFNDSKSVGSFWSKTKDDQSIYVDNGKLIRGWKLINNKWYFMNSDGIMQTGWVQSNGNWYYLYKNGEMASNTITPDGYKVDESGKWDLGKKASIMDYKYIL